MKSINSHDVTQLLKHIVLPIGPFLLLLIGSSFALETLPQQVLARRQANLGPSIVTINGRQLIVQRRNPDGMLATPAPYTIKGVNWSPASVGTVNTLASRRAEFSTAAATTDMSLMQTMNVNTVRTFLDPTLDLNGLNVLDQLHSKGIMVILTVDEATNNLTRVQQSVNHFKNHPAVLMWLLGNEWNINGYYTSPQISPQEAAQRTEMAAALIKTLDTNHPVATSYGEIDIPADGLRLADTQMYVSTTCPSVDVWGLQIYRGSSFGTLFGQWQSITPKPLFISEFGTDAFQSDSIAPCPSGTVNQTAQANYATSSWNEIFWELSALFPNQVALGGTVFEWNDEWWKTGAPTTQETCGYVNFNHPDAFANEEYFGIVTINRQPRQIYTSLQSAFAPNYQPPNPPVVFSAVSAGFFAGDFAAFAKNGEGFCNTNNCGQRGFSVAALDPCTGTLIRPLMNFDTWASFDGTAHNQLIAFLQSLPNGTLVMIAVGDEAGLNNFDSCTDRSGNWLAQLYQELEALGSTRISEYCYRDSWALISIKGTHVALAEELKSAQAGQVSIETTLSALALISPTTQSFSANGGNGTINVVAATQCTWTAASNVSWATITSSSSGSGNGSVTYSVQPNNGVARIGTLSVASQNFTLTQSATCATITLSPITLPNSTIGTNYNETLSASGGTSPYSFTLLSGMLPTGLSLSAAGVLNGTPSVAGIFNFTIKATDNGGCMGTQTYVLTINSPCDTITVNPTTLPNGFVGVMYNQTFTQTGSTGSITWSISAGALPAGLNLAANIGAVSGTPTTAGAYTFTIKAAANSSCMGTRQYTMFISGNGLQFYPLAAPVRLLDTRHDASPNACSQPNIPIAGQTSRTQPGRNICAIPANALALTGNVTTVQSGGGFLTLYPSDAQRPTVASTNYGVNEIINNVFTVGLGADGAFKIFANNTTDVVVDVTGYYAPPATGGLFFHPLPAPVRLLETRAGLTGCVTPGAPLAGNAESTQQAISPCTGIPASARAIVGNATTVGPQGGGFLTIFPADAQRPLVASSNYSFGQVVNGPFAVGLAPNGQFKIFTTSTTDLVVDVLGYYSSEVSDANGVGLLLTPLAHPIRLLETRLGQPVGCFKPGAPLAGGTETTQTARGVCDGITIPANALGVVGNATVVFPAGQGFLTLWPGTAGRPLVAMSNYNPGDVGNRHFIVGLGQADGAFKIYTHATTDLVIDLSGYFAP
jgi:hypothetical protein